MFKSKFVFAVSFVALFAVGSAWAADSTADPDAGIAGVSYVDRLLSDKQDKLVPDTNIKGAGSVSVSKTDGIITISGTDTKYTLPDATTSAKGGVIVGTNISVSSGKISVADATANVAGVAKLGVIPSGNDKTGTALIWVE